MHGMVALSSRSIKNLSVSDRFMVHTVTFNTNGFFHG